MNSELRRGFVLSTAGHLLVLFFAIVTVDFGADHFIPPDVYSITLEGGKQLGGMMQSPDPKSQRSPVAPPKQVSAAEEVKPVTQKEKELVQESEEPDPEAEVSLAPKPTPAPTPKNTPKPAKSTPVPAKATAKPKATPKKSNPEQNLSEINKELEKAMQRYRGESNRGGGQGFGAAKLGGSGMGGGLVRPPEFFAYLRILEQSIKSGWRWFDNTTPMRTQVIFKIAQDGTVSDIRISSSSGSDGFDDSVVRAIRKASPVPPPPPSVYEAYFKEVRMTFDPTE